MYPSWGNYGGSQPPAQNFSGPRDQQVRGPSPQVAGFGGYETPPSSSLFSSLREQHLQQMQQLQQLHQKQLQSVLHHNNDANAYGGGSAIGCPGPWQSEVSGYTDMGPGVPSYYQDETQSMRCPPQQNQPQPPPPQTKEAQPPQPEPTPPTVTTQNNGAPTSKEVNKKELTPPKEQANSSTPDEEKHDFSSMSLQEQQQYWYKQHLANLQRLKNEKGQQNQSQGDSQPSHPKSQPSGPDPPPPSEPPKSTPPPPPPKEEPPPPPPPEETQPEVTPQDPEEAARLQQLQAAAAQWQQVQQQRAGIQYQALMQQHEQLQQILQQYQQLIQQPSHLQTMPVDMQLRHYEVQQQQFAPVFQDWDRTFHLWYEQFQSYPHKDQLQDYEHQWKQWQEQMNSTHAHLQERVTTLRTMVPYGSSQYTGGGVMGQCGQYPLPGPDAQMQHMASPSMSSMEAIATTGPGASGPPPTGGLAGGPPGPRPQSEPYSSSGPPIRCEGPAVRGARPTGPPPGPPPHYQDPRGPRFDGPRGNGPRFEQQCFEGPPRFDQRQRFDHPQRGNAPRFGQHMRFEQPPRQGPPPRFEQPQQQSAGTLQRPPGPPHGLPGPFQRPPGPQQRPPGPQQRHPFPQQRPPGPQQQPPGPQQRPPGPQHRPPGLQQRHPVPQQRPPGPQQRLLGPQQRHPGPQQQHPPGQHPPGQHPPGQHPPGQHPPGQHPPGQHPPGQHPPGQHPPGQHPPGQHPPGQHPPGQHPPGPHPEPEPGSKLLLTKGDTLQASKPAGQQPPASQMNVKQVEQEDYTMDTLGGFFVQNDPIPQTSKVKPEPTKKGEPGSNEPIKNEKETPPAVSTPSPASLKNTPPIKSGLNTDGPAQKNLNNNVSQQGPKPQGPPGPPRKDMPSQPIPPPGMARGRGRGQPPGPIRGQGRGMRGRGGIPSGPEGPVHGLNPNRVLFEEEVDQMSYNYRQPHEELHVEEDDYQWQEPSLEEHGGAESEEPPLEEERWVPEEHHYQEEEEEEYYEEPVRGGHPMDGGHWEEPEAQEYWEKGDPYWMADRRPPIRGMRPPFPPGRGRPPRGRPGFMHMGMRRPPPPLHDTMDQGLEVDPHGPPIHRGHDPQGPPMHHNMERDMRRPPPCDMERPPMRPPPYHEELERKPGWPQPPHSRGPPPPPHEMMDRGLMRRRPMGHRPMGRGMGRGMRRPPPPQEELEEGYNEDYSEEFGPADDGYGRPPPHNYHPRGFERDPDYYQPHGEWDREHSERDYPPFPPRGPPPPEHFREDKWLEERERPYPYEGGERGRGELRIREYPEKPPYRHEEPPYPPPPEWERPARPPPQERGYPPDFEGRRPHFEDHRSESLDIPPPPPQSVPLRNVPDSPLESAPQAASSGILALSQRQHEIILKAAQELKLIREMQEGKTPGGEAQLGTSESTPELPPGLLGLEIPPEVRSALKATMVGSGQLASSESYSNSSYLSSAPPIPKPPIIPKTVDYGHGHEPGTTVERISYGERIVLRPDPVPSERIYDKDLRDPYNRDPYYERRVDPYMERREYSREREMYREKPPPDYERERFDRERYPPRDDRPPPGPPPRPGYRDRERDMRDREGRSSRDQEETYGRPAYDRPSYERSGPERYDHGSSPYSDRRNYPEERGPGPSPSLPPPQPAPQRVEKKPEIKNVEDLLKPPGRSSRPDRIVIIMRGLPGSGKSHVAKLIRDKEVECGGAPPRVLGLDDYFMTEVEKVEKDPDTGKRIKNKVLEYEFEPEMEDTYRSSMLKTFKKTLDDGFFPFIIIDTINEKVKHFDQFWSAAKTKGFEVYLAEITADNQTCAKRNVHARTLKDIIKMSSHWEPSPRHMVRLDVRSLLQDAAIEEVEMEDFNPDDEPKEIKKEEEEESDLGYLPKSKWEMDTSEAKLDKLDGLVSGGKRKRDSEDMAGMEDFLQLPDDYATRMSEPGKKRVRWADLEEQKDADRKRAIGFVVGQTDWEKITDESGQLAQRALNRTKYF
ncbi:YLP motif-containing protein 1 isoform X1 [Osmerus mordax]|uniref:YLP motif-containing protein 1 isoform X1 n=1 Tax=Osmerus mordax TaxID=8014 RepID=UPI00350F405D